jgi:RNA recognition motif-containing protein
MGRKLYVGNLPFDTGDDELKLAFAQCGTVSEVKVITDRETGRSRGFGFVTMSTDREAQDAISRWSGAALGGRQLTVNEAMDKPRGDSRGTQQGGGRTQQGGYSGGTYVADAPPPDRGRGGGGRDRGRGGRDRGRGSDYG